MNHLTEEQLILYYYGEDTAGHESQHLACCEECRETYGSLQRVLNVLDGVPVPDRPPEYGAEVWRRVSGEIGDRLLLSAPRRTAPSRLLPWRWAAAGLAVAALMIAAFLAGRFYPAARHHAPQLAIDPQHSEQVLLVAVGDYLERSQMVLIELANADPRGRLDISAEQRRAADLVTETRLYRQTAAHTGDTAVAGVLDELERVLLDITHAPSEMRAADIEKLRNHLTAEGILFKIRVLGSNLRSREDEDAPPPGPRQKL